MLLLFMRAAGGEDCVSVDCAIKRAFFLGTIGLQDSEGSKAVFVYGIR